MLYPYKLYLVSIALVISLQACQDPKPTLEQQRVQELAKAAELKAQDQKQETLAKCKTTTLDLFHTSMAARKHSEAAGLLRLCAAELNDPALKALYAEAESNSYIDDIKNAKASAFDRLRAINILTEYYPDKGYQFQLLAADLRMKLQDETRDNEVIIRARTSPSIGMSAEDVRASAWGVASTVNRTTNALGTTEQWVYPGGRYVYLQGDRVTAVQD